MMAAASAAPAPRYSWQREPPRTAGITRRAIAFGVDAVIVFLLAWLLTFVIATFGALRIPDTATGGPAAGLLWIVSIFEAPIFLAYTTAFQHALGRTPGKLLLGLRVARADGQPMTLGDAFLRNLLCMLWFTPLAPAFILVDAWSLRTTELDQRLGDLAAGTVVLETSFAERL